MSHLAENNEAWNNRTQGLSVTDAALEEGISLADALTSSFDDLTSPPRSRGVHGQIGTNLDRIANLARGMLEGLRSPDTGEARTEALEGIVKAVAGLEDQINRAEETLRTPTTTRARTTTATTHRTPTTTVGRTGMTRDERPFCEIINQTASNYECQDFHIDVGKMYCDLVDETGNHGDAYDAMAPIMRAEGWVFGTDERTEAEAAITAALLIDCRGL